MADKLSIEMELGFHFNTQSIQKCCRAKILVWKTRGDWKPELSAEAIHALESFANLGNQKACILRNTYGTRDEALNVSTVGLLVEGSNTPQRTYPQPQTEEIPKINHHHKVVQGPRTQRMEGYVRFREGSEAMRYGR